MGKLVYSAIMSLDGFVADESGGFEWAEPDEEVHAFINDLERGAGTYLFGRRMYELMAVWETLGTDPSEPAPVREFGALWRAAEKVVYSTTLEAAPTERTRIARTFDPEEVRRMKAESDLDLSIGGPTLAACAIEAGLVDEYQLYVVPVVVGGGLRFLGEHVRLDLALLDERRFANGTVHLRYTVAR